VSVVRGADLEFTDLPGRLSADPFKALDPGEVAVRVVFVDDRPTRNVHRHPRSPEVVFVAEGHGVAWQDGTATPVGPGDMLLIPRNAAHATIPDPGSRLKLICFFPDGDLASNLVELEETVSLDEKG